MHKTPPGTAHDTTAARAGYLKTSENTKLDGRNALYRKMLSRINNSSCRSSCVFLTWQQVLSTARTRIFTDAGVLWSMYEHNRLHWFELGSAILCSTLILSKTRVLATRNHVIGNFLILWRAPIDVRGTSLGVSGGLNTLLKLAISRAAVCYSFLGTA